MRYEVVAHTADTGIIAYGRTLAELFENAAYAMFDLMFDLAPLVAASEIEIVVEGEDLQDLMFGWLSELLFRFEVDGQVWCRFRVGIEGDRIRALVGGTSAASLPLRGSPIKAVTMHDLEVVRKGPEWAATVIFDV
ncbi:MAG: archease [Actinobacteria bacterium]|nr:archease [Actinomycetota bacterium]